MQTRLLALCLVVLCCATAFAQTKPVLTRPEGTRKYTTVLAIDGGGFRCLIPVVVAQEIENSIKRYLLDHPEYWPEGEEFESIEDFDVLLADFFDGMAGVSGGSWTTGYLASKGGNGAANSVFRRRNIRREYGTIVPGQALGLEVFFYEYGGSFYPAGINVNVTAPPAPINETILAAAGATTAAANATATAIGAGALTNISTFASTVQALPAAFDPTTTSFFLPQVEIPGVNAPVYPTTGLEETLQLFLGDVKLSEMSTYYVAHAYDLNTRRTVYFINDQEADPSTMTSHVITRSRPRRVPRNSDDDFVYTPDNDIEDGLDFYVKDILRGSSAVPGFHESHVMSSLEEQRSYTLTDGATVTNNPALQAVIFLSSYPRLVPISNMAMISLGTGVVQDDLANNADAGPLGWLLNNELISIMGSGSAELAHSQVDYLFYGNPDVEPGQYLRVQYSASHNSTDGEALGRFSETEDLPTYERIGRRLSRRFRSAIDRFVSDFIFAESD